ncbi:MAG: M20/M25/M40 family metallo-hydrolase [Acidobacteriota bacterium]
MSTPGPAADLAVELVSTPSVSGEEETVARRLETWARQSGVHATRDETGVRLEVAGGLPGPTLLLASHLDTVPAGEGWTIDPFAGLVEGGVLRGRGAVDAKASVAAMAAAAAEWTRRGGPARGRLVVLATFGEETRHTSMPRALERLGAPVDAALIGEPTGLEPCVAQRGLLVLTLRWRGAQVHAGWAADLDTAPDNAILVAADQLARLEGFAMPRVHPRLGRVAFTPTRIEAGIARNVTPPVCEALLDVRTTPAHSHGEIVAALRAALPRTEVEVVSDRLRPVETPDGSRLLEAIRRVRPGCRPFASPTSSDWVFLADVDGVKLGPGDSRLSHTPDEAIALDEIDEAARLYAAIAGEYLS